MKLQNFILFLVGVASICFLPACNNEPEPIVCTEADRNPETELGPNYWPLYGTWRLENVGVDEHENADGPVSGFMHDLTWNSDGTFVVEWEDDVIQVGHIEGLYSVELLEENRFHITVDLESDCFDGIPWFSGEYTVAAATDSVSFEGQLLLTGLSFPWGNQSRIKALFYDRVP